MLPEFLQDTSARVFPVQFADQVILAVMMIWQLYIIFKTVRTKCVRSKKLFIEVQPALKIQDSINEKLRNKLQSEYLKVKANDDPAEAA